eukprot:scaffold112302_cov67-Phaeocystis_antarctica.AAC.8
MACAQSRNVSRTAARSPPQRESVSAVGWACSAAASATQEAIARGGPSSECSSACAAPMAGFLCAAKRSPQMISAASEGLRPSSSTRALTHGPMPGLPG